MIHQAILKDIPYLLEIEDLCFIESDRFTRNQFRYAINRGKGLLLVDFQYTTIYRGYIYILNTGRIYSLAVHPAYRGHRIGRALLKSAETSIRPLDKVTLEVRKDNESAIKFYSKNSYNPIGIKHNYYTDGMDAIIMKKDLINARRGLVKGSNTL